MENNTNDEQRAGQSKNSNTIFGTSSDDIVEGLHSGAFVDLENGEDLSNPDDSSMIVNEQEQNEIVNPVEEEFTQQPATEPPAAKTAKEKNELTKDEIEGEIIDDGMESKDEASEAKN